MNVFLLSVTPLPNSEFDVQVQRLTSEQMQRLGRPTLQTTGSLADGPISPMSVALAARPATPSPTQSLGKRKQMDTVDSPEFDFPKGIKWARRGRFAPSRRQSKVLSYVGDFVNCQHEHEGNMSHVLQSFPFDFGTIGPQDQTFVHLMHVFWVQIFRLALDSKLPRRLLAPLAYTVYFGQQPDLSWESLREETASEHWGGLPAIPESPMDQSTNPRDRLFQRRKAFVLSLLADRTIWREVEPQSSMTKWCGGMPAV